MAIFLPSVLWLGEDKCFCQLGYRPTLPPLQTRQATTTRGALRGRPRSYKAAAGAQESSPADGSAPVVEVQSFEAGPSNGVSGSAAREDEDWLLRPLVLAVVAAAIFTGFAVIHLQASSTVVSTGLAEAAPLYKLRLLGREILIKDCCPGWIYFWLLMAAGFGLFVSEEALNVWVGATLARRLTFNGLWMDFLGSVLSNASYIIPTVLWVYWGVCISDMVPFYAGRFAARTKAGDMIWKKVGVSKNKLKAITQTVQHHGNLIGLVERFSLGVRNPTSFVAGAMGVSPEKYLTGVCLGALVTLPLQMGVGLILREHPMAALAGVAAAVGTWTVLPYIAAGFLSAVFIIRRKVSAPAQKASGQ